MLWKFSEKPEFTKINEDLYFEVQRQNSWMIIEHLEKQIIFKTDEEEKRSLLK